MKPTLQAIDNVDGIIQTTSTGFYDLLTPGEYDISYVAIDSAGNETELVVWLYVLTTTPAPNDYPEMDEGELASIKAAGDVARSNLSVKESLLDFNIYSYYSSLNGLDGEDFFIELYNIINVTQVSYGDVRYILELSDVKHSIWGTYLHGIYDNKKLIRYWNSSGPIQREHVWPQSYLTAESENSRKNIASDLHNIRAIFGTTNNSRDNNYFVSGSGINGNQGNGTYYPGDDHRGDVARILFYMHVRYKDELYLTSDANAISSKTLDSFGRIPFGLLDVLLEWHYDDPVDEFEIYRNNVIYMYQGNRNPFIDHPEYAGIIFAVELADGNMVIFAFMNIDYDLNMDDLETKSKEEYFN